MTPDEVRQTLTGWCSSDENLEFTGDQHEQDADYAFGVRTRGERGAPVDLQVLQRGGDRLLIRHTASLSSSAAESAQKVLDQRPGWIWGTVDRSQNGTSAVIQTQLYLDGLNRNSFMQAVSEVAHTARLLSGTTTAAAAGAGAAAQQAYGQAQPQPSPTFGPQPSYSPTSPMPSPYQPVASQPQPQQSYTPAQQSYTPQSGAGQWVPTHTVPPQGLRAWASPDPAGPVVANLAPGLPVQVAEVRGAWARVVCSNGWVGWIDGRIIGVAA
jgi:hypothetical protein